MASAARFVDMCITNEFSGLILLDDFFTLSALESMLRSACITNNKDIVTMLLKSTRVNINANNSRPFNACCAYGHLELAKFIHSKGIKSIQYAFDVSCEAGELEVVKWLWSLNNIDISNDNYYCLLKGSKNTNNWLKTIVDIPPNILKKMK
jgi:hypothetical protein